MNDIIEHEGNAVPIKSRGKVITTNPNSDHELGVIVVSALALVREGDSIEHNPMGSISNDRLHGARVIANKFCRGLSGAFNKTPSEKIESLISTAWGGTWIKGAENRLTVSFTTSSKFSDNALASKLHKIAKSDGYRNDPVKTGVFEIGILSDHMGEAMQAQFSGVSRVLVCIMDERGNSSPESAIQQGTGQEQIAQLLQLPDRSHT